jgi:hypothetical protein
MSGSAGPKSYTFRISAEGMAEFVQDLQRTAASSDAANLAIQRLIQSSPQLASGLLTQADATERAARRAAELRVAQEAAATSAQSSAQRIVTASASMEALEGRANAARRGVNDLRAAMELLRAGSLSNSLGGVAGFVGNMADLFGTAALAAGRFEGAAGLLAGRLTMLAGVVALPVFLQSVGLGINGAGEAAEGAAASSERFRETLNRLDPTLQGIAAQAAATARQLREVRTAQGDLERSVGGVLGARGDAIGQISDVDAAIRRQSGLALDADARALEARSALDGIGSSPFLANRRSLAQANAAAREAEAATARGELTRLQNLRLQLQGEVERLNEDVRAFDVAQMRLAGRNIYDSPIGPPAPDAPGLTPVARAGRASDPQAEFDRAEQLARRTAERAIAEAERAQQQIARTEERELQQRERANERTVDNITRYLADGFADSFREAGGGFGALLRTMQQTAQSTIIRVGAEAIIRPVISAGVSAVGGAGGLSELLGLSGLGSQVSGLLGLGGGTGGGIAGLLSAPLTSSLTLGQGIGGLGIGFTAGSLAGRFTARSSAQRTNSQIGSGVGALAGTAIGGPLGGLIGGALGGAAGGLLGPGEGFSGGEALIGIGPDGFLRVTGTQGKNFDTASLAAQTEQQVAQINAALAAQGLRFDAGRAAGWTDASRFASVGGGSSTAPTSAAAALAPFLSLITGDAPGAADRIFGAASLDDLIGRAGTPTAQQARAASSAAASGAIAERLFQINNPLDSEAGALAQMERRQIAERESALAAGLEDLAQLEEVHLSERILLQRQFAERSKAETERAEAEKTRIAAQAEAEKTRLAEEAERARLDRARTAQGILEGLTFGGLGGLSPAAQGAAARQALSAARNAVADGATQAELSELSRVASATLPVIQRSEGITGGFGALVSDLAQVVRGAAPGSDVAGLADVVESQNAGADRITEAVFAAGGTTAAVLSEIRDALARQGAQIEALMRAA